MLQVISLFWGVTLFERVCISSEIYLKSWSFVWAFQCRLLQLLTNLVRERCDTCWKNLHELRNIFEKLKLCTSFSMSSIAASYEPNHAFIVALPLLTNKCDTFWKSLPELRNIFESWSFVWAFQCRPLHLSPFLRILSEVWLSCQQTQRYTQKRTQSQRDSEYSQKLINEIQ